MSPLKTVVFLCGLLAVASLVSASVANNDEFVFAEMVESTSAGDRAMLPAAIDPAFAPAAMASPYSGYFPRMMEQVPAGAAAPAAPAAAAPAAGAAPSPNPDAPATAAYAYYNYPYSTAPPVPPPMPTYLPLPPYVPSAEVLSLGV